LTHISQSVGTVFVIELLAVFFEPAKMFAPESVAPPTTIKATLPLRNLRREISTCMGFLSKEEGKGVISL
jgi:hypothetical protein